MKSKHSKLFILYDARALYKDTDDATVFVTAHSEQEAKSYHGDFSGDSVWFEYDLVNKEAVNEKMRLDIRA